MANKDKLHDGHRLRLKKRFLEDGLKNFDEHQVLELLLFYCIPRQNTNDLAHALINRFGSLSQVLTASPVELQKVPGIGENAAIFLSILNAFCSYYYSPKLDKKPTILDSAAKCSAFLVPRFHGHRNEMVQLLCLDAKGKLLCHKNLGEGSVNSAAVPIRRIVEIALSINASAVVLAHNHPSGVALPSPEDELTTRQLAVALSAVDITLADHLIIADGECISMRMIGKYHPDECRMLI